MAVKATKAHRVQNVNNDGNLIGAEVDSAEFMKITDGTDTALVTTAGSQNVLDDNSAAILVDTTSIDGKITACNTGAVVVSSGAITETNLTLLSKEEDAAHSSSDKGIMALTVRADDLNSPTATDGDYQAFLSNENGILRTQAQQHLDIEGCNATDGWTVLGNDTISLATTTNHVCGTLALEFDKVDGADNTVFAGIQKTISSTSLVPYHKGGGFFLWSTYVSDITNVDYLFLRLGTDSSNYNEFRIDSGVLIAGWIATRAGMTSPTTVVGDGWNSAAITYVAVGVAFNLQNHALADIVVDHIAVNTGLQTSTDISAEVSSSVSTPNVNILKVGNTAVTTASGNVGAGSQRVTIATDDVNLAAIKTAVEALNNVSALVLTGGVGVTEDTQMEGMYYTTTPTSDVQYFYLPENATNAQEIINILFAMKKDDAETLSIEFQALQQGATNWKPIPAYTTGEYAGDGTSEDINSAFPLRHVIAAGNQYRVVATVGGSCTVGVQVMGAVL